MCLSSYFCRKFKEKAKEKGFKRIQRKNKTDSMHYIASQRVGGRQFYKFNDFAAPQTDQQSLQSCESRLCLSYFGILSIECLEIIRQSGELSIEPSLFLDKAALEGRHTSGTERGCVCVCGGAHSDNCDLRARHCWSSNEERCDRQMEITLTARLESLSSASVQFCLPFWGRPEYKESVYDFVQFKHCFIYVCDRERVRERGSGKKSCWLFFSRD